jgi:beta-glucosidase
MTALRFPNGFLWGAATSAYQIEGGVHEDDRGESIWDRFSHAPGNVANGDNGDVSTDHYRRWREDVATMAAMDLGAYRFSIAWPRLFPDGRGPFNVNGAAFYDRLVDALLDDGIVPAPTLYHWDLPAALDDEGGWLARETADRFADYATACFDLLGDRVTTWFTINEPWVASALGYRLGIHAPGHRNLAESIRASHHLLLAHGRAADRFRSGGYRGRIGIVLSLSPTYPASDTREDREAAVQSDGYTNRWFLEPVLRGTYPDDMRALFDALVGPLDYILDGDEAAIGLRNDVLGVNYYSRRIVRAATDGDLPWAVLPSSPGTPLTDGGWEIVPECLTDLLVRLDRDYPTTPLLITENGAVYLDGPGPDGRVPDTARIRYVRDHLVAAHRALAAGVRLEGYFYWSLLDNFEWADGYRPRFGLVHVDYPTGRRILKESGRFYASVIAANAVDPDADADPPSRARAAVAASPAVG